MRGGWTVALLENTRQDTVYALRALRRTPAFTATAILSVALGIGASVAIFTVADNLLLRPLPYREPGRLMMIWENNLRRQDGDHNVISPANFRDWKAQNSVFESMATFTHGPATLQAGERVEEVVDQYVTANVFDLLGVKPVRGRLFTPAEDLPGASNVALISYRLWQNWFAGDDGAVGRVVQLRGKIYTIIGVMPRGFYLRNRDVDVWETLGLDPARDYRKGAGRFLFAIGRLKPGVAMEQAQTQMHTIAARLTAEYPEFDTPLGCDPGALPRFIGARGEDVHAGAAGRGLPAAGGGLRECGEPAPGAAHGAAPRDGGACGHRRRALARGAPVDYGEPGAGRDGRRARNPAGARRGSGTGGAGAAGDGAECVDCGGRADCGVRRRTVDSERAVLRAAAFAGGIARGCIRTDCATARAAPPPVTAGCAAAWWRGKWPCR